MFFWDVGTFLYCLKEAMHNIAAHHIYFFAMFPPKCQFLKEVQWVLGEIVLLKNSIDLLFLVWSVRKKHFPFLLHDNGVFFQFRRDLFWGNMFWNSVTKLVKIVFPDMFFKKRM